MLSTVVFLVPFLQATILNVKILEILRVRGALSALLSCSLFVDGVSLVSLGVHYGEGSNYGPFPEQVACVGDYVSQDAMGGGLSGGVSGSFS